MHVLDYLADPRSKRRDKDALTADYRLLCSGIIHRDILGEWSKCEISRFLTIPPLLLYVVSRPFTDYPLELVLRVTVTCVEEEKQGQGGVVMHSNFHPDAEVVRDLAALLTLYCRRLITVGGKASQRYADHDYPPFDHVPMPLANSMRRVFWPTHPATVITSSAGQEIRDHNPPPLPVEPCTLTTLLLQLPKVEHGKSIVASARLYALALELVREQPEIAYQLLISAVETIANSALRSFQPDDDFKVEHQRAVFNLAAELDLGEEKARQLAVAACKKEYWATKKFKKFLTDNVDDSVWEEDDLFRIPSVVLPRREDFERVLGKIYTARSQATHLGQQFPASATYCGGPMIAWHVADELFWSGSDSAFPPVVWFERIVNNAIRNFWRRGASVLRPMDLLNVTQRSPTSNHTDQPIADFLEPVEYAWTEAGFEARQALKRYSEDTHADP